MRWPRREQVRWEDIAPYRFITVGRLSGNRVILDAALAGLPIRPRWLDEVQHLSTSLDWSRPGSAWQRCPSWPRPEYLGTQYSPCGRWSIRVRHASWRIHPPTRLDPVTRGPASSSSVLQGCAAGRQASAVLVGEIATLACRKSCCASFDFRDRHLQQPNCSLSLSRRRASATAAAASRDRCGVAIMMLSAPARRGSPRLGVSSAARARCVCTAGGASMP